MTFFTRMFRKSLQHNGNGSPKSPQHQPVSAAESSGTTVLDQRLNWYHQQFRLNETVTIQRFISAGGLSCAILYTQGLTDTSNMEKNLLQPLMQPNPSGSIVRSVADLKQLPVSLNLYATDDKQAVDLILEGFTVLLMDGQPEAAAFLFRSPVMRQITDPSTETSIRGPRDSFVEDIETNLMLIHRRIKHPAMKVERTHMGTYTKTMVALVYIDELCKPELVQEVKTRLSRIKTDSLQGNGMIEEFIEDQPFSPFPQLQYSERPDTVTMALLEGRFAIFTDGTPMTLIAPVTLYMLLQSAEDYYQRYISATWIRWIRYVFLLVSFLGPSTYIAVTTFHPEMLPPNLLLTVAASRDIVPFPAIVEAFLMEISFEALREAGIRIPKPIGQTVSIIGAIVIGQAAVQAGVVSAPLVIIVSITGIASFIIPHYDLGLTFRLLRFPVMLLAASFGLFGIIVSILLIYMHLVSLRSFGTPYLTPTAPLNVRDLKDMAARAPWWMMRTRPTLFGTAKKPRLVSTNRPEVPMEDDGD